MLRADASAPRRRVGLTTAVAASKILRVASTEQVLVPWPAASLHSREAAELRVRVGGNRAWSEWSAPATVEAGLLRAEDWTAGFVSPSELGATGALAPVLGATLRDSARSRVRGSTRRRTAVWAARPGGNRG